MKDSGKTYRQLKRELDETLERLQYDNIDIDEALSLHARGQDILKQMQRYLDEAAKNIGPEAST